MSASNWTTRRRTVAAAATISALAGLALSGCGKSKEWYSCKDPALTVLCWLDGCPKVSGRDSTASGPYETESECKIAAQGGPGGDNLLTCDAKSAKGLCIHYTFTSAQDRDSIAAQCTFRKANDHSCPSGGVGCRHTTATRTSETFVWDVNAAAVKKDCLATSGTPL